MANEQEGAEYTAKCLVCGVTEVSKQPELPIGWAQVMVMANLTRLTIAKQAQRGPKDAEIRDLDNMITVRSSRCPKCIPAIDDDTVDMPSGSVSIVKPEPKKPTAPPDRTQRRSGLGQRRK